MNLVYKEIIRKNILLLLFFTAILFVALFVVRKSYVKKPNYLYVKVRLGQGLWWASTDKPSNWLANSIKKGDIQYDLLGQPKAQILEVRKYPALSLYKELNRHGEVDRYEVYLLLKLKVDYDNKSKSYTYDRSNLSIGGSIDVPFPRVDVSGTVMDMNINSFNNNYEDKIIYLVEQDGYQPEFPYKFDGIKIGDVYSDGQDNVFTVIDKYLENSGAVGGSTQNIVVKAKVKVKNENGELYYGEDYKLVNNAFIPFSTNNYYFENFIVSKIE